MTLVSMRYVSYTICGKSPVIVFLLLLTTYGNCEFCWVTEPDTIRIFQGGNVTFNWAHNSSAYVDMTWYYIGSPDDRQRETIMLKAKDTVISYGSRKDRLHYDQVAGNAAMGLTSVLHSDAGEYEVKVTQALTNNGIASITSVAKLEVYSGFSCDLNIDGTKAEISLGADDSVLYLLPDGTDVPRTYNITLNVHQRQGAPSPVITVRKILGSRILSTSPLCPTYYCHRYVNFNSDDVNAASGSEISGQIEISIDFGIYNKSPFVIAKNVTLEKKNMTDNCPLKGKTELKDEKINMIVTLAVVGWLLVFIFTWTNTALALLLWKKPKSAVLPIMERNTKCNSLDIPTVEKPEPAEGIPQNNANFNFLDWSKTCGLNCNTESVLRQQECTTGRALTLLETGDTLMFNLTEDQRQLLDHGIRELKAKYLLGETSGSSVPSVTATASTGLPNTVSSDAKTKQAC